jgi:hypothetical protein
MNVLAPAFAIACGLALILFGVTLVVLLPFSEFQQALDSALNVAKTIGGVIIASFPVIAEFLERQKGRKNLAAGKQRPVYDFRGFQITWPLMAVYGTIIVVVVFALGPFLVGFIRGFYNGFVAGYYKQEGPQIQPDELYWADIIVSYLVSITGSYLVGRWIGTRCARRGVVAILLIGPLASAIYIATNLPVREMEVQTILHEFAIRTCIFWGAGLFGHWRGKRYKLSAYLHYLMRVLPAETRETVVELTFEEAQKVGLRRG